MKAADVPDEWAVPAREAYDKAWHDGWATSRCFRHALAAVAPMIAAAERERCAKVAEREAALWMEKAKEGIPAQIEEAFKRYAKGAQQVATAIRALKDTP